MAAAAAFGLGLGGIWAHGIFNFCAKFNPAEHEAMAMMPTDQQEPNTVAQVVQKGYRLNENSFKGYF